MGQNGDLERVLKMGRRLAELFTGARGAGLPGRADGGEMERSDSGDARLMRQKDGARATGQGAWTAKDCGRSEWPSR